MKKGVNRRFFGFRRLRPEVEKQQGARRKLHRKKYTGGERNTREVKKKKEMPEKWVGLKKSKEPKTQRAASSKIRLTWKIGLVD